MISLKFVCISLCSVEINEVFVDNFSFDNIIIEEEIQKQQ